MAENANTTRRLFLKGAVIAAATPAVAFAPAIATTISGLIAAYADADNEHYRLIQISDEIFDRADNPGMPYVLRSEISPRWQWQFKTKRVEFRDQIAKGFDDAVRALEYNRETFGANASQYDTLVSAAKAEKHRVLVLFEARDKVYRDWRVASGLAAVSDELNRLEDVRDDLETKIVAYRCETLDDVRAKVSHVQSQYGDQISGEYARHVLTNLIG